MEYEIVYEVCITKKKYVRGSSEDDVIEKFHDGEYEDDGEEYSTDMRIFHVTEIEK